MWPVARPFEPVAQWHAIYDGGIFGRSSDVYTRAVYGFFFFLSYSLSRGVLAHRLLLHSVDATSSDVSCVCSRFTNNRCVCVYCSICERGASLPLIFIDILTDHGSVKG
jgi:hypothetical protein